MKNFTLLFAFLLAGSLVFSQGPTVHNPNANVTITNQQINALGQQHTGNNPSGIIVLNFEGLGDNDSILNFYNGGTSQKGFSGVNYGVAFTSSALAIIDQDAGGSGNFANEPSPSTILYFLTEGNAIMNVASGFTSGFSCYYTAHYDGGSVALYDGLDGTGNLLGSTSIPANFNLNCTGDPNGDFCHWDVISVPFTGLAKSVVFSGTNNQIGFDDVTFGSVTPGCSIPTLSEWGMIILALLLLAAGTVYIRRRQYSFATAGSADATESRKSLFDRKAYFMVLAILLGISVVIFAVELFLSVRIPVQDIAGAVASSAILAFIIQSFFGFRK
jgi:hypothetical protein